MKHTRYMVAITEEARNKLDEIRKRRPDIKMVHFISQAIVREAQRVEIADKLLMLPDSQNQPKELISA